MTITSRPKKPATMEAFIEGAPDAQKPRGVRKGNRLQISLTIAPELLAEVDAFAAQIGQSRAGIINMGIALVLGKELKGLTKVK